MIRDIIYFDFEKAASIYSQIDSGLIKSIETEKSEDQDKQNKRTYNFKVFKLP